MFVKLKDEERESKGFRLLFYNEKKNIKIFHGVIMSCTLLPSRMALH